MPECLPHGPEAAGASLGAGGCRVGYADGGGRRGGPGRFVVVALTGAAAVALIAGHGSLHIPVPAAIRADTALAARDLAIENIRTVWIPYRGADGRDTVLRHAVPAPLLGRDEQAWQESFPGFRVEVQGSHVTLRPDPGAAPFRIGVDRGRVVVAAGSPLLGLVVERTPLLAGTLPLSVRQRLYSGVPVTGVPAAWRQIAQWMA